MHLHQESFPEPWHRVLACVRIKWPLTTHCGHRGRHTSLAYLSRSAFAGVSNLAVKIAHNVDFFAWLRPNVRRRKPVSV